jgi:hypothetical protein
MRTAPPPTKSGTTKLSDIARHVVAPKRIASTGWPAVRDKCATLGISFRDWQHGTGRVILAKRADGKYAATIGGTGLSIPRQVGKTFLIGAIVFALCLLHPNLTVIWTAHRLRTAEETFGKMQAFAKKAKIRPHILKVVLGSGEEEIRFRNGSRILFGARESGFGLGFDEVDVLIFDEAQRLRDMTLDDMVPATNQSRHPAGALLLFMGTPPRPTDPGEVFTRMRTEALTGEDDDTGWVEFGADPDYRPTPAPAQLTAADWAQVAKANPSFPHDTPRESILRMRKKLGPESFLREGLGIWDEDSGGTVVDMDQWGKLSDPTATVTGPVALGVAIPRDRSSSTVSVSWLHGERVFSAVTRLPGTSKAVELIRRKMNEHDVVDVSLHSGGPAGTLVADLEAEGVEVTTVSTQEFAQATGAYRDGITNSSVGHVDQYELTEALRIAPLRTTGDGEMWDQRDEMKDIAPVVAVTLSTQGFVKHAPTEYDLLDSIL